MNLFVGIIVQTFSQEKEKIESTNYLSAIERKWISVKLSVYSIEPKKKAVGDVGSVYRNKLLTFISHKFFDSFIMICITINTLSLTLTWYD